MTGDGRRGEVTDRLAGPWLRCVPVFTWNVKTVPRELLGLAKDAARWKARSATWLP